MIHLDKRVISEFNRRITRHVISTRRIKELRAGTARPWTDRRKKESEI